MSRAEESYPVDQQYLPLPEPPPHRQYPPPEHLESPVQLIQGWYYVIAGLWVSIGLASLQSSAVSRIDLQSAWFIRAIGVIAVLLGMGLIAASRERRHYFLGTWVPVTFAVVVAIFDAIGLANTRLPSPFIVDMFMELSFVLWWAVAMCYRPDIIENPRVTA